MGYMYYQNAGTDSSPSPFTNLQFRYQQWSGTQWTVDPRSYYFFDTRQGRDEIFAGGTNLSSWPVRSGDIDADGDGAAEQQDNCTLVVNPTQLDANGDGYGNACDADLNNSALVTTADFGLLRSVLNQSAGSSATAAAADLNGSGTVTTADFAVLRSRLNTGPGPSGYACAGTVPGP